MADAIRSYKDLLVWQKALDLVDEVYTLTAHFPKEEMYGLANQLRRAAVSVPSNIAEGHARRSRAEYRSFLGIARGSMAEVETQLIIASRREFLSSEETSRVLALHDEISRMLSVLHNKISESLAPKPWPLTRRCKCLKVHVLQTKRKCPR